MVKQLAVIDMKECGVTEKLLVLQEVTLIPHMLIDKLEFENDDWEIQSKNIQFDIQGMVPSIVVDISCPTAISASSIEGGELIDTYGTFGVEGTVCGTGTS